MHSDEDRVLGVDPPTHFETGFDDTEEAGVAFRQGAEKIRDLIDLLSPSTSTPSVAGTASYRPNTAFIMMPIDKAKPELQGCQGRDQGGFRGLRDSGCHGG